MESRVELALVSGTRKAGPVLLVIAYDLLGEGLVLDCLPGNLGGGLAGN